MATVATDDVRRNTTKKTFIVCVKFKLHFTFNSNIVSHSDK